MTHHRDPAATAVLRHIVRAAILRSSDAFDRLALELKDAYARAWDDAGRAAVIAALDTLRELGPGKLTESDTAAIIATLRQRMGPDAMMGLLHEPVVSLSDGLWRLGPHEVGASAGVDLGFMSADLEAIALVTDANLYWIANSWNSYTDGLFRGALTDYFREGMTREQLAERFASDFAGLSQRSIHYWEMLADHTATKTREIGRVTGYERAGIEAVQVRAHLDDNTTKICRGMHGKIIPVTAMRGQVDAYLDAVSRRDVPAAKASWVMHPDDAALDGLSRDALPVGTATPPYHFRCRTITVMWVG
jgi:hypothetical protein